MNVDKSVLCWKAINLNAIKLMDAIVKLITFIIEDLDNREQVLGVFLDLSRAFDCTDFQILFYF